LDEVTYDQHPASNLGEAKDFHLVSGFALAK